MLVPGSHLSYQITVRVDPADIDELDHVNNAVYLRWVQEAAVAHWRAIASPQMQADTLWVVLRHEIDYKAPALPADHLIVTTWIGAATRLTFTRHTQIDRAVGTAGASPVLLAKALTLWCPLDAQSRRPKRVDAAVRSLFAARDE